MPSQALTISASARSPTGPPVAAAPRVPAFEYQAWKAVSEGWRRLHGNFRAQGMSIERHEFESATPIDWGTSFHPDSVEICLNLEGHGEIESDVEVLSFAPGTVGFYVRALEPLRGVRRAHERHRFITVELSHAWLRRVLIGYESQVSPALRATLLADPPRGGVGTVRPLTTAHEQFATALARPPVSLAARHIWFEAKALELLAETVFEPEEEFFCVRQHRVERDRVTRAKEILIERLIEPPTLEELAREIGISGSSLSRTFSKEVGQSIPQFIRQKRIELAADMIRRGTHNIGESAFAVGYSSLGHFSKSFLEIMGVSPKHYARSLVEE